jgi:hypothetical protein
VLPGARIFFSLNFETAIGSKSAKTSLQMKLVYKLHLSIQLLQEGRDCEWKDKWCDGQSLLMSILAAENNGSWIGKVPKNVPFA